MRTRLDMSATPARVADVRASLEVLQELADELFVTGTGYSALLIARATVSACLASWTGEPQGSALPVMVDIGQRRDIPRRPEARHLSQLHAAYGRLATANTGLHPASAYSPPVLAAMVAVRGCAVDWSGLADIWSTANVKAGRHAGRAHGALTVGVSGQQEARHSGQGSGNGGQTRQSSHGDGHQGEDPGKPEGGSQAEAGLSSHGPARPR